MSIKEILEQLVKAEREEPTAYATMALARNHMRAVLDHVAELEMMNDTLEKRELFREVELGKERGRAAALEAEVLEEREIAALAETTAGQVAMERDELRAKLAEAEKERDGHHDARNALEVEQHKLRCKVAALEAENAALKSAYNPLD